jgi:secondary thiamine-phosphate synthase enzyme
MLTTLSIQTKRGDNLINITEQVRQSVTQSGVQEGLCVLIVPHTTAALTLNSTLDTATPADIIAEMKRLVPTRVDFEHQYDTPADAAGHIKASLVGQTQSLIIHQGRLVLGGSQSILFFEFDGPRQRKIYLKIIEG